MLPGTTDRTMMANTATHPAMRASLTTLVNASSSFKRHEFTATVLGEQAERCIAHAINGSAKSQRSLARCV